MSLKQKCGILMPLFPLQDELIVTEKPAGQTKCCLMSISVHMLHTVVCFSIAVCRGVK